MKDNNGDSKFPVESSGLREQHLENETKGISELKLYPSSEYIYTRPTKLNEKVFEDDEPDVADLEQNDEQEYKGIEDEENTYFSLQDDDRD